MTRRLRVRFASNLRSAALATALALPGRVRRARRACRPLRRHRKAARQPARRAEGEFQGCQHHLSDASGSQGALARLPGKNYSTELYAKGDRRPKPEFYKLVGAAAAIVFTVTKDDTTAGTTRCLKRMGILRGDKVTMRFRRLNMECTRTKTDASIAITRGKDE